MCFSRYSSTTIAFLESSLYALLSIRFNPALSAFSLYGGRFINALSFSSSVFTSEISLISSIKIASTITPSSVSFVPCGVSGKNLSSLNSIVSIEAIVSFKSSGLMSSSIDGSGLFKSTSSDSVTSLFVV